MKRITKPNVVYFFVFISYTPTAPVDVVNDDVVRLVDIIFNNYNVVGVCVVVGFDVVLVNV